MPTLLFAPPDESDLDPIAAIAAQYMPDSPGDSSQARSPPAAFGDLPVRPWTLMMRLHRGSSSGVPKRGVPRASLGTVWIGPFDRRGSGRSPATGRDVLTDRLPGARSAYRSSTLRRTFGVAWVYLQLAELFHFAIGIRGLSLFAINTSQAKMRLRGKRSIFSRG